MHFAAPIPHDHDAEAGRADLDLMHAVERYAETSEQRGLDDVGVADRHDAFTRAVTDIAREVAHDAVADLAHRLAGWGPRRAPADVPCAPSRIRIQLVEGEPRPFAEVDFVDLRFDRDL